MESKNSPPFVKLSSARYLLVFGPVIVEELEAAVFAVRHTLGGADLGRVAVGVLW